MFASPSCSWRLFNEHEGDAKERAECIKRVKDARRMADGCSIVHSYYYHNHDMWPQIYSKLWRAMNDQLSRMSYDHPDSCYRYCTEHITIISHAESWRMFWTFQNSQHTSRCMQNLVETCRLPLQLLQITTGIFPTFISVDNQDHKSAKCGWGFSMGPFTTFSKKYGQNVTISRN